MNKVIKINRRQFNYSILATSTYSLAGKKVNASEKADVIIIGAGLAGLNAALNLEAEGYKVLVLEGEDYVGGRVKTLDLPNGKINLGGQTIGPYYARVRDIAFRLSVPLVAPPSRIKMGNFINGQLVSDENWSRSKANKTIGTEREVQPAGLEYHYLSKNNPLPDVESWISPSMSKFDIPIYQHLKNSGASEEALRIISVTANVQSIHSASALAYLRDLKRLEWGMPKSDDENTTLYSVSSKDGLTFNEVEGGTQRLTEAMASALKGEVRLNQIVRKIGMTKQSCEVVAIDGTRYNSRYVISAVPFSALRKIEVSPGFPKIQKDSINYSSHSNTLRVFLEFSSPFWDDDIGTPGLYSDTSIERVFARRVGGEEISILDCWVNGNGAYRLDQLSKTDLGEFVIKMLEKIRPSTKGKLRMVHMHSWSKSSLSGCCRHVYDAGQIKDWSQVVSQSHNRLYLAGEQTRSIENGMEAAAKSGERAAFEIMENDS
jgi:monoamine oxidase